MTIDTSGAPAGAAVNISINLDTRHITVAGPQGGLAAVSGSFARALDRWQARGWRVDWQSSDWPAAANPAMARAQDALVGLALRHPDGELAVLDALLAHGITSLAEADDDAVLADVARTAEAMVEGLDEMWRH